MRGLFGRRATKPKRITDNWPLSANGVQTTYGEMRFHAENIASRDARNGVEEGLALSILALLDDAEQRAA